MACDPLTRISSIAFAILALSFFTDCEHHRVAPNVPAPPANSQTAAQGPLEWTESTTPFPAVDITAVGNTFWICGADEMIASSTDGGRTWKIRHQKPKGKVLLHIAFVNDRIAHAAGQEGVFLSTRDAGNTWTSHQLQEDVLLFSFVDADRGIAALGPPPDINRPSRDTRFPYAVEAIVKLTHDAGEHWEEIPALRGGEFKPFTRVQHVAALDSSHYLAIVNQAGIEDAFAVTTDAGKSWKLVRQRNDDTNREFAKLVFIHDGEYWAFGQQMLERQKGGGHLVSMTRHSKDGTTWDEGPGSDSELGTCNAQSCYLWDGAVERLYGPQKEYWNLPQDGSLSGSWAIATNRACTIDTIVQCGPALVAGQPQKFRWKLPKSLGKPFKVVNQLFAKDCIACGARRIPLDPGMNWQGKVVLTFRIEPDGSVADLSEDGAPGGPLGALIEEQLKHWRFSPPIGATSDTEQRHLPVNVKCVDAPEVPTVDGCELTPADVG